MKTDVALNWLAPTLLSEPSLPEITFAIEMALWQQVEPEKNAVHILAAAHGVRLALATLTVKDATRQWRNAPKWLHRLCLDPSPTTLATALLTLGYSPAPVFGAIERFDSLRAVSAPVNALLLADGDKRSALSPVTGLNRYGCAPLPQPGTISLSACSGNEVGRVGFAAGQQMRLRLMQAAWAGTLGQSIADITAHQKARIAKIMGVTLNSIDVMSLVESGTAATHLVATHLTAGPQSCLYLIVGPKETGREIPEAVSTAPHVMIEGVEIREGESGEPVAPSVLEYILERRITKAIDQGMRVILQVVEGSKTGLVAPGIDVVRRLIARFPNHFKVVADFCQMRPGTCPAEYLELGASIVATGSKFLGGPVFSGVAIEPKGSHTQSASVGTVLRWEAALAECENLSSLSESQRSEGLRAFAHCVLQGCDTKTGLIPVKDDSPAHVMTVHVLDQENRLLDMEKLRSLHTWLASDATALLPLNAGAADHAVVSRRCLIGQPVMVGDKAALRIALTASRLVSLVRDPDGPARLSADISALLGKMDLIRTFV